MKNGSAQLKQGSGMLVKSETRFGDLTVTVSDTAFSYLLSSTASTSAEKVDAIISRPTPSPKPGLSDKVIAKAVLNYLRFQRYQGRVVVRAGEVARALSLSVSEVEKAATALSSHGVKVEA